MKGTFGNRPRMLDCHCCGEGPAWTDGKLVWCDACLEVYPYVDPQGYVPARVMPAAALAEEAMRLSGKWLSVERRKVQHRQVRLF